MLELTENYTPEISDYKVNVLIPAPVTLNISLFYASITTD